MLPQPVEMEPWMATFHINLDDSGKFANKNNKYVTMCGYVAHASEWNRFGQEWMNCRHAWQVPPVHMSPILYPDRDPAWQKIKDDWGSTWEGKRDQMLKEFASIVMRCNVVCIGAVVDAEHYRSMPKDKYVSSHTPISFAFQHAVIKALEKIETTDKHSPISIVIDDDREDSMRCYELLATLRNLVPRVKDRIDGICFVNDRSYPAIQAADMIAYESRKQMEARAKNGSNDASDLYLMLTRWGIHQPSLYTPELLDKWHQGCLTHGVDNEASERIQGIQRSNEHDSQGRSASGESRNGSGETGTGDGSRANGKARKRKTT
jgi:Protein of unknown function (DUF3800)